MLRLLLHPDTPYLIHLYNFVPVGVDSSPGHPGWCDIPASLTMPFWFYLVLF